MKKRDLQAVFASFLVASTVLAGCGSTEEAPKEEKQEEAAPAEETEEKPAEETEAPAAAGDVQAQIDAHKTFGAEKDKLKEEGGEVDWAAVEKAYNENLQAAVNDVNGEFAQGIEAAIAGGQSGEIEPVVAMQLVDKLTQSYFYQKQKSLQKDVIAALTEKKADQAKASFEEIKLITENVIVPTAEKRDNYYELTGEKSIAENINNGLKVQEEALQAENADDYQVYSQLTDKSAYKVYYLAANGYAEKIEAAVKEGKEDELQIMQAEAYGFYQAIKESLAGGDEEASKKLDELFSLDSDPKAIKASEVNSLFNKAIIGKITSYHEKAPAALEEDKATDAKTSALEGNMFMNMIDIQLNKQLGEDKAAELHEKAEKWYAAIEAGKADEAKPLSEEIVSMLGQVK
ncbi:ribosomal protein S20 [Bacillus ectoiniformans]|uniref:hypothetical protein n=1 Tax=Bacillus ectoiniformans TaxID=1494429 RepID=UPI00195B18BE|nr:hypothetical protein [Bacillus ectoiniformans]MBM7648887.1 ribosomal protein S20 [Bacillus ectoiniformans]